MRNLTIERQGQSQAFWWRDDEGGVEDKPKDWVARVYCAKCRNEADGLRRVTKEEYNKKDKGHRLIQLLPLECAECGASIWEPKLKQHPDEWFIEGAMTISQEDKKWAFYSNYDWWDWRPPADPDDPIKKTMNDLRKWIEDQSYIKRLRYEFPNAKLNIRIEI